MVVGGCDGNGGRPVDAVPVVVVPVDGFVVLGVGAGAGDDICVC